MLEFNWDFREKKMNPLKNSWFQIMENNIIIHANDVEHIYSEYMP